MVTEQFDNFVAYIVIEVLSVILLWYTARWVRYHPDKILYAAPEVYFVVHQTIYIVSISAFKALTGLTSDPIFFWWNTALRLHILFMMLSYYRTVRK